MGCKQTKSESPSLAFTNSPTAPITPIYVKSALKPPRVNGKGKVEKRSATKRNGSTINKSVNFDEKVRVKLRTPTPKQTRYADISSSSSKVDVKPIPNHLHHHHHHDDTADDSDDQLSSISSQEEIPPVRIKSSTVSSNLSLQRNQSNGLWQKNNSVATTPLTSNDKRKTTPPPARPPPSVVSTRTSSLPPPPVRQPTLPPPSALPASSVITTRLPSISTSAGIPPRPLPPSSGAPSRLPPPSTTSSGVPPRLPPPPPSSGAPSRQPQPLMGIPVRPVPSTGVSTRPPLPPSLEVSTRPPSLTSSVTVSVPADSAENPAILTGTRFRVRRRVPYSASPQIPSTVDVTQSSPLPIHRTTSQAIPPPPSVKRPSSNTDAILIEHPTSSPDGDLLLTPALYGFTRRSVGKNVSTEK